ncbi:hypothetical protein LOZ36_003654 [Ophidiomyces ophidiicola]|nr:hypothetical protein LOZ36_003654 [Ophidiomyces ophidiicola]
MPHKHKRRRNDDGDHFDLPPSKIAKALPPRFGGNASGKKDQQGKKVKEAKNASYSENFGDDTPREFARMMRKYQESLIKPCSTKVVDEGSTQKRKKRTGGSIKREEKSSSDSAGKIPNDSNIPKLLPGEKLSEFAIRVDQALPLSGVSRAAGNNRSSKVDADIRDIREHRQTKHEKRLLRLQTQWRKDDVRIREKEEAEREELEAQNEEVDETWKQWEMEAGNGKRKKKKGSKKKRKKGGEDADDVGVPESDGDDDPWAKLNKKKRTTRPMNPFDVVQAPPEKLTSVREVFKVHGMAGAKVDVANVPAAAGSLRRREELATHRQDIVDEYRRVMAAKRGQ